METKKSPSEVDEEFSYVDCMKYNAILDMKQDFTLFELGVNDLEHPKSGS